MSSPPPPLSSVEAFGAFAYWPEHLDWSFQLIRLVGQATSGGSDFSEVHGVARDLVPGDADAWQRGFWALAERVEQWARKSQADGELVTARESWFRAAGYYRAAGFMHDLPDPRHVDAIDARRRCFAAAATLSDLPIEPVEIAYEDTSLPGYVIGPRQGARCAPAVVMFGGLDAVAEEMYFYLGRALAERGFVVLAMDGPGMGEALRRGIVARHDYEAPVAAAIDLLQARADVDGERIGLVGQSMGGYYAARAAAFESRLRTTVIWGACYALDTRAADAAGALDERLQQILNLFGAPDKQALHEISAAFTLDGVLERIQHPTLVLHAESDSLIPYAEAERVFTEIGTGEKELIRYRRGEPGCTHCQLDSLPVAHRDIGAWLERRLVR